MQISNISEDQTIKQLVVVKFWPVAVAFYSVFIPVIFFYSEDYLSGWILLGTFLFFIASMLIYLKKKHITLVTNMLALLGLPTLIPWLITGGPADTGFWWSCVYVVWAFLVTDKKSAVFWLSAHLLVSVLVVFLSYTGIFKIAYSIPELLNILFAYIITFSLVYLFNNVLEHYLEVANKREDLKRLNEELASANKELEQFVYVASHDLREPLQTISNFAGLLEEKCAEKTDDEAKQFLSFIMDASLRMETLISHLLDLSRVGRNISLKNVDCNQLVKEVIAELDSSIKEENAKITCSDLPAVIGDPVELKRLFQNLISNAIKFHKKNVNPEVKISAEEKQNEFIFAVNDNGIGIDEKYKERIFVIFQRLQNVSEYPGTGIGLATCKKIVTIHNGKIWVDSKLHEGSTFYFSIPKKN